jgi:hypothetical protein
MKFEITVFPMNTEIVYGLAVNDALSMYTQRTGVDVKHVNWEIKCEDGSFNNNAYKGVLVKA